MNITQLIDQYIEYRQSLGEKFKTNATILKSFCNFVIPSTQLNAITDKMVHQFLYRGEDTVTSGWFVKHTALLGFYKYAVSRGYTTEIPLPKILPKRPPPFVPYIFSKDELKRLFNAAFTYQKNRSHIEPHMVHTVLVLMYALGLRPHETLSLRLGDLDMDSLIVIIQ